MLWQALTAVRDIGRLHDIASILIRYGFGDMVRRMGMANALERAGRALHWNEAEELAHLDPPARVRRAMEALGPTFVKLGQLLATRVDLFEPEWIAEFSRLQDSAHSADYQEIHQQLTEDLGAAPEAVFAGFDPEPLAAASMAQVYRARLEDGTEVVVKVRRPDIRLTVEADLRWMARLADLAEGESPELRAFQPREVVRQFTQSLRRELDFGSECRNAERIAQNFAGYTGFNGDSEPKAKVVGAPAQGAPQPEPLEPIIVIPRVYWQWTSERVCVQEYIAGISGRQLERLDQAGLDRKVLARRGAQAVLKMIVEDGFFHADPHPGNVFYLPGNRIAFIDFGMVGRLSEVRRDQLMRLLLGLVQHEPQQLADVMIEWTGDGATDEDGLILEIQAFVSLEGMGHELDPDFNMAAEAMPLLQKTLRARYAPNAVLQRGWHGVKDMLSLLGGLPQDVSRLLRAAKRGRLEIHIDVLHLKRLGNQLDSAANRLVVGVVVAALIIGSSIVMTVPGGPTLLELPFFGLLGFIGALLGSLWLLVSIWRSGYKD